MPPYKYNQAAFPKYKGDFDMRHSLQRVAGENALGTLKQRFQRLDFVDTDSIEQSCRIILGACVLHNLCCNTRDEMGDFAALESEEECEDGHNGAISTNNPTREACEQRRKTSAQTKC
ncbi:hypothetical protein HPB48_021500 [Haemaphysalis longicornis]|uniref:DDE Tnp4 domain-containing protein n=1 Tax=Haemaphysalis longicornis TaxID=44386 RepID=A0A9J6G9U5_HAELO|nr:hypothetical protein HPB48_021500 [Haemaphysalis longicornis]